MSLPSTERTSPREIASAAAASGRFHDVVIAASKVLHGTSLTETDRAALRWARELLNAATGPTSVLAMPAARHLAAEGNFAAMLRQAARPADGSPDEPLRSLRQGIDACLTGAREERVLATMARLRELFVFLARLILQADVQLQGEPPRPEPWTQLTSSSSS